MKWGIIGLPQVGKTTLFQVLTRTRPQESHRYGEAQHLGVVSIPDERLDRLARLFPPAKVTYATAEFVDVAALRPETMKESVFLQNLRAMDGLVHVVRLFHNAAVPHVEETLDPRRDLMNVEADLILADLGIVENRLEKLEKDRKKIKSSDLEKEQELLARARQWLESGTAFREASWTDQEKKQLRGYAFLSEKPMLVVLNVDEAQAGNMGQLLASEEFRAWRLRPRTRVEAIAGTIEAELATLPDSDVTEFLAGYGLTELGSQRILRATRELLDLITFFTLGEKECRAWMIPRGSTALQAAATVHTDFEKHFIRAETVGWEQFVEAGGWAAARTRGGLKLEGKEYLVQEGEVLHIRHSG